MSTDAKENVAQALIQSGHYETAFDVLNDEHCGMLGYLYSTPFKPDFDKARNRLVEAKGDRPFYAKERGDMLMLSVPFYHHAYGRYETNLSDFQDRLKDAIAQYEMAAEQDNKEAVLRLKYLKPLAGQEELNITCVPGEYYGPAKSAAFLLPDDSYGIVINRDGFFYVGKHDEAERQLVAPMLKVSFDQKKGLIAEEIL